MIYFVMAAIGAAAGWYIAKYMNGALGMNKSIILGVVGGLVGGLIADIFSFAAVILFELVMAALGAVLLIYGVQRYQKQKKQ